MDEDLSRKDFCGRLCGGLLVAWSVIALPGCGGGGGDYGSAPAPSPAPSPAPPVSCGNAIADNHGHALVVAPADLDATTDQTYDIRGTSPHTHQVTLSVAQLAALKAGGTVNVTSTTTDLHAHAVSVTCA